MVKDNFISVYEEKPWVSQALHLGEEEALSYSCCHMTDQFHMMKGVTRFGEKVRKPNVLGKVDLGRK